MTNSKTYRQSSVAIRGRLPGGRALWRTPTVAHRGHRQEVTPISDIIYSRLFGKKIKYVQIQLNIGTKTPDKNVSM